ncbi:hypothetical protein FACS1894205_0640 [Alphaproteobacteria bacterium]|nr:hypothetical protein FACS1894205_0640 [Alphaproteobacteria bacterium]
MKFPKDEDALLDSFYAVYFGGCDRRGCEKSAGACDDSGMDAENPGKDKDVRRAKKPL